MPRRCAVLEFLLCLTVIGSADAYPDLILPKTPFEATAVYKAGPYEHRVTVHYANGKLRIDPGGGFSVTILNFTSETECLLMANHTYLVLPMDDQLFRSFIALAPAVDGAQNLGGQNIDGMATTKFTFTDPGPLKARGVYWLTASGIMVRRTYADNHFGDHIKQAEYLTHLTLSRQSASLFAIPPGYKPAR